MNLTRRDFFKTSAAVAGGVALAGLAGEASWAGSAVTTEQTRSDAVLWFTERGYEQVKPVSLVTGHQFNGGLAYDESLKPSPRAVFVVQPCARVEDVRKRDVPGTLPLFEMLGFAPPSGTAAPHRTALIVGFLTRRAGLDAGRLRITTTELARPLLPELAKFGVREAQVRMRPLDEARREGAGSGWFAPPGHPLGHAYATFSVEYVLSNGLELEIAELGVDSSAALNGGGGIGLDRVTMARNDRAASWKQSLPQFKQAVEEAAKHAHKPLPSGYYAILEVPEPKSHS